MPESLTESFCERCGTRYAFKAPTTLNPLRKARGLAAGLKNYVMSSDSMSEAVADAMHDETEAVADRQRQAFDRTFNFCMTCRQYACKNCWNPAVGSCLTCAPTEELAGGAPMPETAWPDHDVAAAAARLAELTGIAAARAEEASAAQARLGPETTRGARLVEDLVWPDLLPPLTPPQPSEAHPASEPGAPLDATRTTASSDRSQPAPEEWPGADLVAAGDVLERVEDVEAVSPEPVEVAAEARETLPASAEPALTTVSGEESVPQPAQPEEVAAHERVIIPFPDATAAPPQPYRPAALESEHEVDAPAAYRSDPAPAVSAPEEAQVADLEPRWPELAPADDAQERVAAMEETPEAAARREQLDVLGLGDPGSGPAPAPERVVAPPLPVLPRVDDPRRWIPTEPAPSRVAAVGASGRDGGVAVAAVAIQDCSHCGLSLSASARFCRRCGQRQLRSA